MTATIRGRIWRTNLSPSWGTHNRWIYEVRDGSRLLVRSAANTHQDALSRTCRHIRLAHEMAGS